MPKRPKFTIRHLIWVTVVVAICCAFAFAGPYAQFVIAALLMPMLPAALVAAIAACFTRSKKQFFVTSICIALLIWTQIGRIVPEKFLPMNIWGLIIASVITGVIASLTAQAMIRLRSRTIAHGERQ